MGNIRRTTVGSVPANSDINRDSPSPSGKQEQSDINERWPENFGSSTGESREEIESYKNVYDLVKDYPYWLALLNANPYKGFDVPESLFDQLGLSNKAKDKMMALRQEYMQYNADILAKFMEWQNSLPKEQREQLVQAGYNADLVEVSASKMTSDLPRGSAMQMPSGSTADDLMKVFDVATQTASAAIGGFATIATTLSQVSLNKAQKKNVDAGTDYTKKATDNLGLQGESLDIDNFGKSLDVAKRIYSNIAPRLENPKNPDEIMSAVSIQYPDAPKRVNDALKNYVNSREFQQGVNQAAADVKESESNFFENYMTAEDLNLLVRSPQYWLGIKTLTYETYQAQLKALDDYLDTLDVASQVRMSNEYTNYMATQYAVMNQYGLPASNVQTVIAANNAALSMYELQRQTARRNKLIIDAKWQEMSDSFDVLTNPDSSAWSRFWAAGSLTRSSYMTRWTDPQGLLGTPQVPTIASPQMPSFNLPSVK